MKKFRIIRKDSGLKSGSREVSLTEALKSGLRIPVQKELSSRKFEFKRPSKKFRLKMKIPVYNPVQGKYVSHNAPTLSISSSKSRFKKNLSLAKS